MIPASVLRGPVKEWTATLQLDGHLVDLAGDLPSRSLGFGQARGTCSLATRVYPDVPAGCEAKVLLTLNRTWTTTFFTGRLGARPIADSPLKFELGLVDSLARLDTPLEDDIAWHGQSFTGGVRDLLHAAGFDDGEIGDLFNPGSDYKLGPIDTVVIKAGTTVKSALDDLLTYGGCGLFVLPEGQLSVIDAPGWPADTDANTPVYAFGATGTEFGFFNARRTVVSTESVVSKFTAKGNRLSTKKIADATFTLSGVTGQTVSETYQLLQTDACAKKIAAREIVRRNRSATEVDVSCPLNPDLRPGDTVLFRHPELGFPTNTAAIIIGCSSSGDEQTLSLSVGSKPAEGDISIIPPPKPSFTMRYEVQPVKLAGMMAVNTVVECVDTSTDPSGFGITGREWKAECAGNTQPEPADASWSYDEKKSAKENPVPNPIFVFPTLEGARVTLSVESESGEGGDVTQAVVPPASEVFTRTISVATGATGWRVLAGSSGWRDFTTEADCTAVPTINDNGPLLAGFSDGAIYQTDDYLATPPALLSTLPAAVNCLWINEGNPLEVLAGAGTGLYRSSSGGMAWAQAASFPDEISYCENSPANPSEIRVCAGNKLYLAMNGTQFSVLLSGPEGSLCRKVGSAPWGHLAVFSGTSSVADAWKFEEPGISIDWSQVPAEVMPTDLAAVTPLQYEEGYLVADGGASDLIRDGLFGQLGYLANLGATQLYKLIRSGSGFAATSCGEALDGGPHKVVMSGGKAFPIDVGDAYRIGYGQATDPARPPQVLVVPPGSERFWRYYPDTARWEAGELPVAGENWGGLDINPNIPTEWVIWTSKRVFWTGTAGQTWAELYMPGESSFYMQYNGIYGACFTGTGSDWLFSFWRSEATRASTSSLSLCRQAQHVQKRVAGGSGVWKANTSPAWQVASLRRGYGGEVWAHATEQGDGYQYGSFVRQVWIDPATLTITDVGETVYDPSCGPAPGPNGTATPATARVGYSVWSANVARTPNYRTTVPDEATMVAAGNSVAACQAGVFVGGRKGIAEIRQGLSGTEVAVVAAEGLDVGTITIGSRRRGAGAVATVPGGVSTIFAHNGMQWAALALPDGVSSVNLLGVIEL